MNVGAADVLEMLREQYPFEVPAPSAELETRMNTGVGVVRAVEVPAPDESDRRQRRGILMFDVTRRRHRVRAAAAVLVATLVLMTGLGVAGALPAPLQRPFGSALRHVGIDVPVPDDSRPATTPASEEVTPTTAPIDATAASAPAMPAASGASKAPAPSEPGLPPVVLPLPTLPAVTLPPVTLPPATLPGTGDSESEQPPPAPPVDLPVDLPVDAPAEPVDLPALPPLPLPNVPAPPLSLPIGLSIRSSTAT